VIDLIAITVLAIAAVRGYRKGLIIALFSAVAVVLGIWCALRLSAPVAAWLQGHGLAGSWAPLAAYLILFLGVGALVRWGAQIIQGVTKTLMLGFANRAAGAALYVGFSALVLSSVLWLAGRVGALGPEATGESVAYPYLAPVAPWVYGKAVAWKDARDTPPPGTGAAQDIRE